ncbi:carbohydrate ABC transporter permease [Spirochaeta lutea]|uniref:Sugar ABC transporter permease n=1 Tax=Spirochaeta lutea TaxID=1480694 RepID=A0A098R122_9SPIO|nr:sugar ABC transporter permease [Spirochaeta lutea]KGE73368.1 sugar ABC transporter permease [Spirochaeta lutea]
MAHYTKDWRVPTMLVTPSLILVGLIVVFPIAFTVYISLTNMNIYHWNNFELQGFQNYIRAFSTLDGGFIEAFLRTVLWTLINLILQYFIALGVGLMLNTPRLRFQGLYRTIFMIPWAVPGYISALIWRNGLFNFRYGLLNKILVRLGLEPIQWLSQDFNAFIAVLIVNLWLALPFMILVVLGGLQSIDKEYYESAQIDGANLLTQIQHITVPLLRPVLVPAMTITAFVTFKQFDIVYLMTQQMGSKTGADIHMVITYAFENAFVTNNYGFSSALSVIIFVMIILMTVGSEVVQRRFKTGGEV